MLESMESYFVYSFFIRREMSVEEYIGSILSIETNTKEAYQGQLTEVDTTTNSLKLTNVFINGIYSPKEDVIVQ